MKFLLLAVLALANFAYGDVSICGSGFAIFDATNDVFMQCIADGSVVNLALYGIGPDEITFEYAPEMGATEAVQLKINGVKTGCELTAPYTAMANAGEDYFPFPASLGELTVAAKEFSANNCRGINRINRKSITITLIDECGDCNPFGFCDEIETISLDWTLTQSIGSPIEEEEGPERRKLPAGDCSEFVADLRAQDPGWMMSRGGNSLLYKVPDSGDCTVEEARRELGAPSTSAFHREMQAPAPAPPVPPSGDGSTPTGPTCFDPTFCRRRRLADVVPIGVNMHFTIQAFGARSSPMPEVMRVFIDGEPLITAESNSADDDELACTTGEPIITYHMPSPLTIYGERILEIEFDAGDFEGNKDSFYEFSVAFQELECPTFSLVDAGSDVPITLQGIADGDVFSFDELETTDLSVVVGFFDADTTMVQFYLDGEEYSTESQFPYAFNRNKGDNIFPAPELSSPGTFFIEAEAIPSGERCGITFTLEN